MLQTGLSEAAPGAPKRVNAGPFEAAAAARREGDSAAKPAPAAERGRPLWEVPSGPPSFRAEPEQRAPVSSLPHFIRRFWKI